MDVVIRTPHGEAEVTVVRAGPAAAVAELVERVIGTAAPPVVEVDGRAVHTTETIGAAGVLTGSVIDLGRPPPDDAPDAVAELVQVAGWGSGARQPLPAGHYRVGPGRRVNAPELDLSHVDSVAFELAISDDGTATVTARRPGVRIGGVEIDDAAPWTDGLLDVAGRTFELQREGPRPMPRAATDQRTGTVPFNRPPRRAGAPAPLPHVAHAMHLASTASSHLWSTRPGDPGAFEFAIGLDPSSATPVTVDLRGERSMAFVGPSEFTRAAARGLLVGACVQHGPADLGVVVLTDPDRLPAWEWVKWLPHAREAGTVRVLVTRHEIDLWLASLAGSPAAGTTHRTLAVVDEPAWWQARDAPVRQLLTTPTPGGVRLIVLAENADAAPAVCTTLVSQQPGDTARVERLDEHVVLEHVRPFLLAREVAGAAARALAPFDDPERRVPAVATLPISVRLIDLLGPASGTAATIAARWRATGAGSAVRFPLGLTANGPFELDLDRHGPHVLVGGEAGSGKSELLKSAILGLAAALPPGGVHVAVLDGTGRSSFERCAGLPHVVMHHDTSHLHLAARAVRWLAAELAERDERSRRGEPVERLVVVVDEPLIGHPEALHELLALLVDGRPQGVHLFLATAQPAAVLAAAGAAAFGARIGLHLPDDRDSLALLGTPDAIRVPRLTPGRGWVRLGEAEPFELQVPLVAVTTDGRLELRPYVVGRELTSMELRVARGLPGVADVDDDLARLVTEIDGAARAVGEAEPQRVALDPLPDRLARNRLDADPRSEGVPFALVDAPDARRQHVRRWEPVGNLLVYGADGAGTSSLLATLALGAAERHSADELHLYVRDDRTGVLAPLRSLPHAGGVVRHDDLDRFARLARVVAMQLEHRLATSQALLEPRIVVIIDDVGSLRHQLDERPDRDDVWDDVVRIVRDGPAVGICTLVTAKRELAMPMAFTTHASAQLVMRLADPAGYASFGLRPVDVPRFVPGRALDPADRSELQIVEPPAPLTAAVNALASRPARSRPPVRIDGGRSA